MQNTDFNAVIAKYPPRPGVYFFKDASGNVLYVGKALSLRDRLRTYFYSNHDHKTHLMVNRADAITFIETGSEFEALLLEAACIKKFLPPFNVVLKDDKSYIYVQITRERFPRISITRKPTRENFIRESDKKNIYFGPFPSAKTTRNLLSQIRRIFPFCQQKDLKRACFYSHLGICRPCPAEIVKLPGNLAAKQTGVYRKNISAVKKIFAGKFARVRKDMEKQMSDYSKMEKFEEATGVRNQLERLSYITQNRHTQAFMENTNFYSETQKAATLELRQILLPYLSGIKMLEKIECFDISTLGGKFSVGAQAVFVDGIPEKGLYRRYRIKLAGKPNDVAMMAEMIWRRLQHTEWSFPDLIIVDGGKPQVSRINALLERVQRDIPLIGLAKRLEHIVLLQQGKFVEVRLRRTHKALQLLQQMRDEAHRFAVTYHRLTRSGFD